MHSPLYIPPILGNGLHVSCPMRDLPENCNCSLQGPAPALDFGILKVVVFSISSQSGT